MSTVKAVVRKVLLAESQSPAVHSALRALQAAVVSVAVAVVRSQLGV